MSFFIVYVRTLGNRLSCCYSNFWPTFKLRHKCNWRASRALQVCCRKEQLLFVAAHRCEPRFSPYGANKVKYRSKLNIETNAIQQLLFFAPHEKFLHYICKIEQTIVLTDPEPFLFLLAIAPRFSSETPSASPISPWSRGVCRTHRDHFSLYHCPDQWQVQHRHVSQVRWGHWGWVLGLCWALLGRRLQPIKMVISPEPQLIQRSVELRNGQKSLMIFFPPLSQLIPDSQDHF